MSPTISHALLGGALAIILYVLTNSEHWKSDKKFSERMVVLVAFNSFIGPDIFTMFYAFNMDPSSIIIKPFVHSMIGWVIWCLGIMWIWYYIINIKSTEQTKVSKLSVLLLLIAAGEIHFFLDMLDNSVSIIGFADWQIRISLQDLYYISEIHEFGPLHSLIPWFTMTEMFFIGLVFMVLLIYSLFRWQLKFSLLIALMFLITIFSAFFLFGSIVFGKENDFGITLYFGILLVLPIILMIYAME